jgi:predicted membrane metal-binding protein
MATRLGVKGFSWSLHGLEMIALSAVLQFGMLPLMARDFHRMTVMGPLANLFAVPLTGVIVPLGFFTLGGAVVAPPIARVLAWPLGWLVALQGKKEREKENRNAETLSARIRREEKGAQALRPR